jgi:hypothetical protein
MKQVSTTELLELYIVNPRLPSISLSDSPYISIFIGKPEALQIELNINKWDPMGEKGWVPIGDSLYNFYIGKPVKVIDIVNAPNSIELQNLILDTNPLNIPLYNASR